MRFKNIVKSEKQLLSTVNNMWYQLLLLKVQLGVPITSQWLKEAHNTNDKIINS